MRGSGESRILLLGYVVSEIEGRGGNVQRRRPLGKARLSLVSGE